MKLVLLRKFELEKQYKMILKDMPASERCGKISYGFSKSKFYKHHDYERFENLTKKYLN